jgi:hypothetical protein
MYSWQAIYATWWSDTPPRRDVGQHLVSNVEIGLRPGGVIERAPDKVEWIRQGFEGIVELVRRRHGH